MENRDYTVEIDQVSAAEWSAALDLFEDANIYQTWPYGAVRWGEKNLSHLVLKRGGVPAAMAQLRIVRPARCRFGIAYLRWGPLCHRKGHELEAGVFEKMAAALHDEYVRKRGLFLRLLPNAVGGTPRAQLFQSVFPRFKSEPFSQGDSYRTFVLDLTPSLEELRKRLDGKWRNQLNRAEKNGLKIIEGTGPAEFQAMVGIFNEMWQRKQFKTSSDIQEFGRIQQQLPANQQMKVLICQSPEGKPVSGMIGTAMGNSGIYLFGGTNDQGLSLKGSYLLQWRMIQWMKENGVRHYNLGGINPVTNPGVYHFKKGLSGQDVLYVEPMAACENLLSAVFARMANLARARRWLSAVKGLLKRTPPSLPATRPVYS